MRLSALSALLCCLIASHASAGLSSSPSATLPQASAPTQVSTGGDLNGDGYSDLVVAQLGLVQVYLGSATGVHTTPDWQATGPANFGTNAIAAGDLNGDHIADLVVLSRGSLGPPSALPGQVFVWFGRNDLATAPHGG
jgi:hypothetical protein